MKVNIVMAAETILWLVLGAVATFALLTLLAPFLSAANAADGEKWKNWGAAPYAASQEEACRKTSLAIDGFNMPPTVKEHFKTELGATCKGGKEALILPHELLEQMWSGPARHKGPHLMNRAAVEELPVAKSPDGRPYRKGSVVEAAKTFKWTFVHEGKTYVLYLPYVCFNWSWTYGPAPVAVVAVEKCVELVFNAPVGMKVRWGAATTTGPFPLSLCNAQREGNGTWLPWHGQCDTCPFAIEYIRRILGDATQMPHRHLYSTKELRQTLRFSDAVQNAVVSVCLEDADGKRTCGVYMRPEDWKSRTQVEIPDPMWKWDDANCPK